MSELILSYEQQEAIHAYKISTIIAGKLRPIKSMDGREIYLDLEGKKWAWNKILMEFVPVYELEELEQVI